MSGEAGRRGSGRRELVAARPEQELQGLHGAPVMSDLDHGAEGAGAVADETLLATNVRHRC